jgi:RNA polymerase sigma-70 factor (ECF subfamily)
MVARSDQELISATLAGDLDSFDELMKRYERLVFKVVYPFGRSREDALDLTQTVFMKAYRHLGSFRSEANVKTWLVRIACNEGVSFARRQRDGHESTELDDVADVVRSNDDQEQELIDRENRQRLRQGLATLNERHRLAVMLRYQQEMPLAEIAEVLRCSEGMVKNILFRGVRTLRRNVAASA